MIMVEWGLLVLWVLVGLVAEVVIVRGWVGGEDDDEDGSCVLVS